MPDADDVSLVSSAVPDVLAPGLTAVFCGINPGRVSAAAAAHFANPRNDFWRLLHAAGFTPRQLDPQEQFELLRRCRRDERRPADDARLGRPPPRRLRRRGRAARAARTRPRVRARSDSSARRPTAAPSASGQSSARRSAASARRRSSSCPRRRPPTQPSPGRSGCAGSEPFARACGEAERVASPCARLLGEVAEDERPALVVPGACSLAVVPALERPVLELDPRPVAVLERCEPDLDLGRDTSLCADVPGQHEPGRRLPDEHVGPGMPCAVGVDLVDLSARLALEDQVADPFARRASATGSATR